MRQQDFVMCIHVLTVQLLWLLAQIELPRRGQSHRKVLLSRKAKKQNKIPVLFPRSTTVDILLV